MLLKILGWGWIIAGLLLLLKPEWLRDQIKKRSMDTIRGLIFGIAFVLGLLLIVAAWGRHAWLAKVVQACGVLGLIGGAYFLNVKAAAGVIDWYVHQPVNVRRVFAVGQVIFGAVLLTV